MRIMKKMKRFISLLLAVVMILPMTAVAFAAGGGATKGSITVTNPKADKTYTAYKIFDVTYSGSDSSKSYAYSISKDSEWFDEIATVTTDASGNETVTVSYTHLDVYKRQSYISYPAYCLSSFIIFVISYLKFFRAITCLNSRS